MWWVCFYVAMQCQVVLPIGYDNEADCRALAARLNSVAALVPREYRCIPLG